ncbi:hypothetical protein MalM25_12540 [Planctomycetes bacterium MalM25]|nr:hypothetical protein MalM25_12540 [Planctomycetes bacterium MalM25]
MQIEIALVQTGVISADDYVAALARRDQERPPLGQVAIEQGMMAATHVLDVLRLQHTDPTRRFGELAVEKGYLDSHQVATLLMQQLEKQRPVIEHLVELGRLSREQAQTARVHGVARSVSLLA